MFLSSFPLSFTFLSFLSHFLPFLFTRQISPLEIASADIYTPYPGLPEWWRTCYPPPGSLCRGRGSTPTPPPSLNTRHFMMYIDIFTAPRRLSIRFTHLSSLKLYFCGLRGALALGQGPPAPTLPPLYISSRQ